MSMRYQVVSRPDEVANDGCLENPEFCDDKVLILDNRSRRGIRDIFALPEKRWKRLVALGFIGFVVIFILLFVSFMMYGTVRLLVAIRAEETNSKYGLQLIPDLRSHKPNTFVYSTKSDPANSEIRRKYVSEIDKFLNIYQKDQESRQRYTAKCRNGKKVSNKWCHSSLSADFQRGDLGCTAKDNYGFDSGEPCLLFAFKDEIGWTPIRHNSLSKELPVRCMLKSFTGSLSANITYFPTLEGHRDFGSFPIVKIPSLPIKVGDEYLVDNDGEILYDLPPLVFVKLRKSLLESHRNFRLSCNIIDDVENFEFENQRDFVGIKEISFDVVYG